MIKNKLRLNQVQPLTKTILRDSYETKDFIVSYPGAGFDFSGSDDTENENDLFLKMLREKQDLDLSIENLEDSILRLKEEKTVPPLNLENVVKNAKKLF